MPPIPRIFDPRKARWEEEEEEDYEDEDEDEDEDVNWYGSRFDKMQISCN
jgi:hypothetical protein